MGLLERCHAYKDKKARGLTADAGLFAYPVLMAADILIYDSDLVPVGEDQMQHIEVCRDLAASFNHEFGETFVLPKAKVLDSSARVPGIDGEKMSKSYGNTLAVFEEPKALRKQIMRIVTDSRPMEQPKEPEERPPLPALLAVCRRAEREAMAATYRRGGFGYGEVKKALAERAENYFADARRAPRRIGGPTGEGPRDPRRRRRHGPSKGRRSPAPRRAGLRRQNLARRDAAACATGKPTSGESHEPRVGVHSKKTGSAGRRAVPPVGLRALAACRRGPGAVSAWLALEGQLTFAPLLLFPILVGVGVGAANVGLMRIAQMGNRPTAVLGVLLSAAVAIVGQHYLDYRHEVAQDQQRLDAVGGVAPLSVVRTLVVPPGSFSEYLRQRADRGRPITASGRLPAGGPGRVGPSTACWWPPRPWPWSFPPCGSRIATPAEPGIVRYVPGGLPWPWRGNWPARPPPRSTTR